MFRKFENLLVLIFVVFLYSPADAKITKGPYLIHPAQSSMTIMWESDLSENARICYGQSRRLSDTVHVNPIDSSNQLYLYAVKIEKLKSSKKYYYQILMSDSVSELSSFQTAPKREAEFQFVAIGDSRTGHDVHQHISEMIAQLSPDLVISMGDLVGAGGNFEEWGPNYFAPAARLIDHTPVMSTLGDHDNEIDAGANFNYYFRHCEDNRKLWFSFDYGPAHFVSLDYRGERDSTMMQWFEEDMARSGARWKFVYLHRPSYNLGGHRTNWGAGVWPELYRKHKVDIVFAGHSHIYERFYPMKPSADPEAWPVTYITTGGAGAELYDVVEHEYIAVTRSANHLIDVKLSPDKLQLTAYLPDMSILDQFEISKNKKGQYCQDYRNLVKPQELMDVHMVFASRLLIRFNQLPTTTEPAMKELTFDSRFIHEDIPFRISLSDQSAECYRMEPFEGILKKHDVCQGTITLYSNQAYVMNEPYFSPPLIFEAHYRISNTSGIVIGRQSRYYPPD